MIDFEIITGFDWDAGNAQKSTANHAVSQSEAEQVFMNTPLFIQQDHAHSQNEPRIHALGKSNSGRRLHITCTLRQNNTKIRVISARDMSKKERAIYENACKNHSTLRH